MTDKEKQETLKRLLDEIWGVHPAGVNFIMKESMKLFSDDLLQKVQETAHKEGHATIDDFLDDCKQKGMHPGDKIKWTP